MKKLNLKTKIVCTIGPASSSFSVMKEMIENGMSVARLNMSHGNFNDHAGYIESLRQAQDAQKPLALLMDLPALKYRTGSLENEQVVLEEKQEFTLTIRDVPGNKERVSVNIYTFVKDVRPGDRILVGDGEITLRAEQVLNDSVRCTVLVGGLLKEHRGLVVPGRAHSAPYVNDQMLAEFDFAVEHGIDYLALSLVRSESDVHSVRQVLGSKGINIPLICKVETAQAVMNLDGIISASDGVMVARGDLGMELPLERVPMIQKTIVSRCNKLGKPVIVATQMLESMIQASQPTRAEVADVANAVFDGADAVMMSAETSLGKYPTKVTGMMARILAEAENSYPYQQKLAGRGSDLEPQVDDAIDFDACHTAHQLGAAIIMAFTESGSTACRVAKYRPEVPIVVITPNEIVRRRLALVWGVQAHLAPAPESVDDMFDIAARMALDLGLAKRGNLVIITGGSPIGVTGTTNLLKVQIIE